MQHLPSLFTGISDPNQKCAMDTDHTYAMDDNDREQKFPDIYLCSEVRDHLNSSDPLWRIFCDTSGFTVTNPRLLLSLNNA